MTRLRFIAILAFAASSACKGDGATAPPPALSVQITPASQPPLAIGHSVGLLVTVRRGDATVPPTDVVWSSNQPTIASVAPDPGSQGSTVTAHGVGTTAIVASYQSARDSVFISVHPSGPVARVSVAPSAMTIRTNDTYALQVQSRDTDDVLVTPGTLTFQSSDQGVATVSAAGLVTGVRPGDAVLTIRSDGVSSTASVTVVPPPPPVRAFLWTAADGIRDLGSLPGYPNSIATGINASGTVIGYVADDEGLTQKAQHAFVWTAAGGMRDLGVLEAGGSSIATGINNSGQVVGSASISHGVHAVLWGADGTIRDLGAVFGGLSSANAINDVGQVVGEAWVSGTTVPFLWTEAKGIIQLPFRGFAYGINKAGQVLSSSFDSGRPFVWSAATGVAPLEVNPDVPTYASAINDAGNVVGWSGNASCDPYYGCSGLDRAILWVADGTVVDVTTSGGNDASSPRALGLNNRGQVVGTAANGHAFIWSSTAGLRDVGVLGGDTQSAAVGVNDAGQVVGTSGLPRNLERVAGPAALAPANRLRGPR